jgi:hypothetical protein
MFVVGALAPKLVVGALAPKLVVDALAPKLESTQISRLLVPDRKVSVVENGPFKANYHLRQTGPKKASARRRQTCPPKASNYF